MRASTGYKCAMTHSQPLYLFLPIPHNAQRLPNPLHNERNGITVIFCNTPSFLEHFAHKEILVKYFVAIKLPSYTYKHRPNYP